MRTALVICILSFHALSASFSQKFTALDSLKVPGFIDTLFIDRDINNWSIRVFSQIKNNRFSLYNSDLKLSYVPNNPFGLGVGLATRKLLLDIGFNVGKNEDITHRFDMQSNIMLNKHLLELFIHRYRGYNVQSGSEIPEIFRKDLITLTTGINYLYLFNADNYSIAANSSGHSRQKRTAGSFGIGSFLYVRSLSADSSIAGGLIRPDFNAEAQIEKMFGIGGGIQGGFTIIFPLPFYFFTSLSCYPGIGLVYEQVTSESVTYISPNPLLLKLDAAGAFGYNGKRIYVTLRLSFSIYNSVLGYGNQTMTGATRAKLAIGYKLQKRN